MNKSESIKEIATALAKFQNSVSQPKKTSKVSTNYKDKNGQWQKKEYSYSTLDSLIAAIKEPLANNGLSFIQDVHTNGVVKVTTMLMHVSGEFLESSPVTFNLTDNKPQTVGSLITYARRYSLGALLGLASEEDDDGNQAQQQPEQQPNQAQQNKADLPITDGQFKFISARIGEVAKAWGKEHDLIKDKLKEHLQEQSIKAMPRGKKDLALQLLDQWQQQAKQQ